MQEWPYKKGRAYRSGLIKRDVHASRLIRTLLGCARRRGEARKCQHALLWRSNTAAVRAWLAEVWQRLMGQRTQMYACTCTHACMHAHTHIYASLQVCMPLHGCVFTRMCVCDCLCISRACRAVSGWGDRARTPTPCACNC